MMEWDARRLQEKTPFLRNSLIITGGQGKISQNTKKYLKDVVNIIVVIYIVLSNF